MRSVLTILAGACCASLALAQPTTDTRTGSTTTTVQYHRTSDVVGTAFSLGTESVGKVVDVVFNDGGCIDYVLVQDAEGFVVVPWSVVTVNYDQKTVTVPSTTVTLDRLRELRFTEGRLPNFADPAVTQKLEGVWGKSASRSGGGAGRTGDRPVATTPDRKGSVTTPPDRTDPKGATPPAKENPGSTRPGTKDTPPAKTDPKIPPKKDKDKDGR
jgi:hypothetical protein